MKKIESWHLSHQKKYFFKNLNLFFQNVKRGKIGGGWQNAFSMKCISKSLERQQRRQCTPWKSPLDKYEEIKIDHNPSSLFKD
jgi:hypothetical protein